MMTTIWADTETTGKKPINSGAFEIAMLVYRGAELAAERVFQLNPLDDEVLFHDEAYKVHGVPEEVIRSYRSAQDVMPEIIEFLKLYVPEEKLVFAGYNAKFDYGHISSLMFRHGFLMSDYFSGRLIDVYELVKKTSGRLPKTENKKLSTMTRALGIPHDDAHSALADIRATRMLYETIYRLTRRSA